ncbi:hypothetical protein CRG49_005310 [Neisseria sp. N95_16]|nr:hypothetical protein CRG49_005310 [Neisseria sp. N95_16]PJO79029.1 hypothetical protein CWC45_01765 [Neisseria sp. N177_16]
MHNWKHFIFFIVLVTGFYQILYLISDIFLIDYINKYGLSLNFIYGSLNFLSVYLPYFLVKRLFKNHRTEKECKNG